MLWISVDDLSVAGRTHHLVEAALELAEQRHWLQVGDQPVHSIHLTEEERQRASTASK